MRNITSMWSRINQPARGWLYRHDWQLAVLLAAAIAGVGLWLLWPRPAAVAPRAELAADAVDGAQERWVIVHVSGAVRSPGLYRLPADRRIAEAIVAAGGVTETADAACMPNLAAHLRDGKQIVVPAAGRCAGKTKSKVDLNTATREELLRVPGLDPELVDAILRYRQESGGFHRLSELKSALGLDNALYRQLQKSLTVS